MVWSPTWAATDIRGIVSNLFTFFRARQVEALAWASPSPTLTPFTFYESAEFLTLTDFPHCGVVRRRVETEDGDSGLLVQYTLTFGFEILKEHTKANRTAKILELQNENDSRSLALESMFLNCPETTLTSGLDAVVHYRSITATDPLERAISETKTVFNTEMQAILRLLE